MKHDTFAQGVKHVPISEQVPCLVGEDEIKGPLARSRR